MMRYVYNVKKTAARILVLRASHGYTLEEAARQLHIDAKSLRCIEQGELEVTVELLISLSDFYHVPVDFLLLEDDDTPEQQEIDRLIEEIEEKAEGESPFARFY